MWGVSRLGLGFAFSVFSVANRCCFIVMFLLVWLAVRLFCCFWFCVVLWCVFFVELFGVGGVF